MIALSIPMSQKVHTVRAPEQAPESSRDWHDLRPLVLSMVRKDLGPFLRSKLESADVVQDVLGAVAEDSGQWEAERGTHFLAWVEGVVHNRICNLHKFHHAKKRVAVMDEALASGDRGMDSLALAAVETGPAERMEKDRQVAALVQCMDGLAQDQRQLLVLREFDGKSWKDIAELTGRPSADSARMAHGRALGRLSVIFQRSLRQGERE